MAKYIKSGTAIVQGYIMQNPEPADLRFLVSTGDILASELLSTDENYSLPVLYDGAGPVFVQKDGTTIKRGWYYLDWSNSDTPTWKHIYDKDEVDTAISNVKTSLGVVYKAKGSSTIDTLNSLEIKDDMKGNVYNLTDTGTLTASKCVGGKAIKALAGDQILINVDGLFDKLHGIDWELIQTKLVTDTTLISYYAESTAAEDKTVETFLKQLYTSKQDNLPTGTDGQFLTQYSGKPTWTDLPIKGISVNGSSVTVNTDKIADIDIPITSIKENGTELTVTDRSVNVDVPVKTVKVNGTALTPSDCTVNVDIPITSVKVDGTAVTVTDRSVDIEIPLEHIKVNGTEQTIIDKTVDITIPITSVKENGTVLSVIDNSVNVEVPLKSVSVNGSATTITGYNADLSVITGVKYGEDSLTPVSGVVTVPKVTLPTDLVHTDIDETISSEKTFTDRVSLNQEVDFNSRLWLNSSVYTKAAAKTLSSVEATDNKVYNNISGSGYIHLDLDSCYNNGRTILFEASSIIVVTYDYGKDSDGNALTKEYTIPSGEGMIFTNFENYWLPNGSLNDMLVRSLDTITTTDDDGTTTTTISDTYITVPKTASGYPYLQINNDRKHSTDGSTTLLSSNAIKYEIATDIAAALEQYLPLTAGISKPLSGTLYANNALGIMSTTARLNNIQSRIPFDNRTKNDSDEYIYTVTSGGSVGNSDNIFNNIFTSALTAAVMEVYGGGYKPGSWGQITFKNYGGFYKENSDGTFTYDSTINTSADYVPEQDISGSGKSRTSQSSTITDSHSFNKAKEGTTEEITGSLTFSNSNGLFTFNTFPYVYSTEEGYFDLPSDWDTWYDTKTDAEGKSYKTYSVKQQEWVYKHNQLSINASYGEITTNNMWTLGSSYAKLTNSQTGSLNNLQISTGNALQVRTKNTNFTGYLSLINEMPVYDYNVIDRESEFFVSITVDPADDNAADLDRYIYKTYTKGDDGQKIPIYDSEGELTGYQITTQTVGLNDMNGTGYYHLKPTDYYSIIRGRGKMKIDCSSIFSSDSSEETGSEYGRLLFVYSDGNDFTIEYTTSDYESEAETSHTVTLKNGKGVIFIGNSASTGWTMYGGTGDSESTDKITLTAWNDGSTTVDTYEIVGKKTS